MTSNANTNSVPVIWLTSAAAAPSSSRSSPLLRGNVSDIADAGVDLSFEWRIHGVVAFDSACLTPCSSSACQSWSRRWLGQAFQ
jgi:hypothetical protein